MSTKVTSCFLHWPKRVVTVSGTSLALTTPRTSQVCIPGIVPRWEMGVKLKGMGGRAPSSRAVMEVPMSNVTSKGYWQNNLDLFASPARATFHSCV